MKKKKNPALMFLGCSSNAGKTVLTAAMCRIMKQDGFKVAPFKAQNMALNSAVAADGGEMGRAQAMQAVAAGVDPLVRMNPLLLKPTGDTGSLVVLNGRSIGNFKVREFYARKEELFGEVKKAYDSLCEDFDAVVLEGAGSPGEINLKKHDIVNLRMAEYAQAAALLVGDIDRGGVYASFIGHHQTFSSSERELVKGYVVNRFRGDASLLDDAHTYVQEFTGRDVWGVVPFLKDLQLPQEDSVALEENFAPQKNKRDDALDVALLAVPYISNYTDFDAIKNEPDVRLRLVHSGGQLGRPDLVLLPGSKNVPGDVAQMRQNGLFEAVQDYAAKGGHIAGICGGLQTLGLSLSDPYGIEGEPGGEYECLGLLPVRTVLEKEKVLERARGTHLPSGLRVTGFEMHFGQTGFEGLNEVVRLEDGQVLGVGDERIWATYMHGVFDEDEFRRYCIDRIRIAKGLQPLGEVQYRYTYEASLDRLADIVRESLPVERIYRQIGLV